MGNGNTTPGVGTIRRGIQANQKFRAKLELWENDRNQREPWKSILQNGPSVVYERRKQVIQEKDEGSINDLNSLLEGKLPTKEIAVFLSSSFTDMLVEGDLHWIY